MPAGVSTALLWHDVGELVVGDLPFPVKANNPTLKKTVNRLEENAVFEMGGPTDKDLKALGVGPVDVVRMKICDLLEMYEFGLIEVGMGNTYAQPIVDDIADSIYSLLHSKAPLEDKVLVEGFMREVRSLLCK
jgi:5'-deoxynucleotidase YfbR-like HD superfamily hydrolase